MNYASTSYSGQTGYASNAYTGSTMTYSASTNYSSGYSAQKAQYAMPETPHLSISDSFLAENRPLTPMISELGEVKEIIEETYEKITGQEFPHNDIFIKLCDEPTFRAIHAGTGGHWSAGMVGFSFNKYGKGTSEIYVLNDHLDSLLLTLGHEIGHVLSKTLPNKHDEEAKAHAFSLAWMETIRDHNIAGLRPNIIPNPAKNGLHDVAFDQVKYLLNTGASSYDIFKTLAHGLTSKIEGAC